jgi:hypothetical protein
MPAGKHGTKAVIKIGNSTNAITDVTSYFEKADTERSVDASEVTTLGMTAKAFIAGLKDGKGSFDGVYSAAAHTFFTGILGLDDRTIEVYPEGVGAGLVKEAGLCLVTSYKRSADLGGPTKFTVEVQFSGVVTDSVQP